MQVRQESDSDNQILLLYHGKQKTRAEKLESQLRVIEIHVKTFKMQVFDVARAEDLADLEQSVRQLSQQTNLALVTVLSPDFLLAFDFEAFYKQHFSSPDKAEKVKFSWILAAEMAMIPDFFSKRVPLALKPQSYEAAVLDEKVACEVARAVGNFFRD